MLRRMIQVVMIAVCLQVLGCGGAPERAGAGAADGYLFVQVSESGTFDGERLTLQGVSAQTLFFAERPARVAGHLPTAEFLQHWVNGTHSFKADPPNASLAFVDRGVESAVVLELSEPALAGTTLTFRARALDGTPPASFADASLFIDSGGLMQLVAYGAQ